MDIKFITSGADGDIRPAIALGLGLQKAGHQVSIITTSVYETIIIEPGLNCITIIDDGLGNSFLCDPLPQDLLNKLWNVFQDADAIAPWGRTPNTERRSSVSDADRRGFGV